MGEDRRMNGKDAAARLLTGLHRVVYLEELWPKITAAHSNYAGYQRRTDREIPVVVLEPA
jgi:hypothetical protein